MTGQCDGLASTACGIPESAWLRAGPQISWASPRVGRASVAPEVSGLPTLGVAAGGNI